MPGKWHTEMEDFFPKNMQEVKFYCSSKSSNVCRRADICLSNTRTCEIQHSYISEYEIVNRFNDWNKFGKEIIWLIDGNTGIEIDKLSSGNYLIIFKENWKYKSFIKKYDFILLEKDKLVFKIELHKILSGMIEIKEPKSLQETVDYLKTKPDKICDFWQDDNVVKSKLSIYQEGAGNGKTYGIWKSIIENIDRKTYIIVTKQHTAKVVIYEELIDQKQRFQNGEEIFHIENLTDNSEENTEKHYVIKFTHKQSLRECKVIIGTIDSFCYNLSHSNSKGSEYFKGIVDNIAAKGATKIKNGYMRFGGQYIQLSKESELWIDEVQDLPDNYLQAMCKLMYETYCYINVVGDKLQSLEFENNFLTNIKKEGLPNIDVVIEEAKNINRRIKVTNMEDVINSVVNFEKYQLPKIECDNKIIKENNINPIKIIDSPLIYADDTDDKKVDMFSNKIMDAYINEVESNHRLPQDFLIIFPIMAKNVIAGELQSRIQEYWLNKSNNSSYIQYVYLHKHSEGSVINTKDSIKATRIMSIRASKGDGRKVVFVLGVTESSLKKVSNKEINLVYESHLHVALTRAKKQIYFSLVKNCDDIHKRFREIGYVEYLPNISKNINLDKISKLIDKDKLIELLDRNNISPENILKEGINIQEKEQVDWGYHCIKCQTFYYNIILNIINNRFNNLSKGNSQLFVKLNIISNYDIKEYNVKDFYAFLTHYQYNKLPHFPLCNLSNNPEYQKNYCNIIKNAMEKVKKSIKKNRINELNVYESIVLTYMIQIDTSQKYAEMTPMDIYNITHFFQSNTNKETELLNNLKNIHSIINTSGIKDYKNINWNIFKNIELNCESDYFKINKFQFPIIGNNETDIIHIVLKSDISQLNFWDIMVEILLERFLIYNPKSEEDIKKFKDKKINTYLFLLDKNSFIKLVWDWDKCSSIKTEIKTEIKIVLEEYYQDNHDDIYKYFTYIKEDKKEQWEQEPDKIIDVIIDKFKEMKDCPEYIIEFFNDIISKIEDDEDYDYINNLKSFNNKLNKKLTKKIDKYLQL